MHTLLADCIIRYLQVNKDISSQMLYILPSILQTYIPARIIKKGETEKRADGAANVYYIAAKSSRRFARKTSWSAGCTCVSRKAARRRAGRNHIGSGSEGAAYLRWAGNFSLLASIGYDTVLATTAWRLLAPFLHEVFLCQI